MKQHWERNSNCRTDLFNKQLSYTTASKKDDFDLSKLKEPLDSLTNNPSVKNITRLPVWNNHDKDKCFSCPVDFIWRQDKKFKVGLFSDCTLHKSLGTLFPMWSIARSRVIIGYLSLVQCAPPLLDTKYKISTKVRPDLINLPREMTERRHAAVLPPDTIVSTADTVTALLRTKTVVSADHCQQKRGLLGPKWGWRGCQRSTDSWQASASSSLWTWTVRSSVLNKRPTTFFFFYI